MICYKYRMYPNKKQVSLLWKHANKLNFLYNYFLNQRIEEYKSNGKSITRKKQSAELPKLKKEDPILKEIHSQVLQQVPLRLDKSYRDFFENRLDSTVSNPRFFPHPPHFVMPGLDPGIHVFVGDKHRASKSWIRGSSPRMTGGAWGNIETAAGE